MADELHILIGTAITWTDTGGDEDLDLGGLTSNGVVVGSYHDWGVDPRPFEYQATFVIDGFDTPPVVGETVNLYIAESEDLTNWTGPEAPADTTDGAGTVAKLKNHTLGPYSATVVSTTAADNIVIMFEYESSARYHAPVVHNSTADDLLGTSDSHEVILRPKAVQQQ